MTTNTTADTTTDTTTSTTTSTTTDTTASTTSTTTSPASSGARRNGFTVADYIGHVADEGARFARAAETGGLDAAIAACPGWDMRDLVRHLGEIHLWAAANVAFPSPSWLNVPDLTDLTPYWPDLAARWPSDRDLVTWYRATHENLIRVLETAPADVRAFTFLPAGTPLMMWARRQASEIAVHRFDAESAVGTTSHFEPAFAADMVDELVAGFAPYGQCPAEAVERVLHVHAVDTDEHWWVTIDAKRIRTARTGSAADLTVSGTASELYLSLWNRTDDSTVDMTGDPSVMAIWRECCRVEWSR